MYNCIVLAEPLPETDDTVILRRRRCAARRRMATLQAFARNVSLTVLSVPDPGRPSAEHPPMKEGRDGIAALGETSDVRQAVSEAAAKVLDAARIAGERSGAARVIGKLWSGGGGGGADDADPSEETGDDGSVSTADGTEEDYDAELLLLLELFGANLLRTLHFERAREVTDIVTQEDPLACGASPPSSSGPARSSSSGGAGDDDEDKTAPLGILKKPPRPCPSPPQSFPYPTKKEWEMRVLIALSLYVRSVPPHATDSVTVGRFVLKNILETLAREVLGIGWDMEVGGSVTEGIRRIIRVYEHRSSFASLAFLQSPHQAADTHLRPLLLSFRSFLLTDAQRHFSSCCVETMLANSVDAPLRRTMKDLEFTSLEHLLRVCRALRPALEDISLGGRTALYGAGDGDGDGRAKEDGRAYLLEQAEMAGNDGTGGGEGVRVTEKLEENLANLQREVVWINGRHWVPGRTYEEMLERLMEELTRTVSGEGGESDNLDLTGVNDEEKWEVKVEWDAVTVERLVSRLFVAASRTGVGGDAYFVVCDLFGGEGVAVSPSQMQSIYFERKVTFNPATSAPRTSGMILPTIEINILLTSLVIKCHSSFDIYPEDGADKDPLETTSEPLVQLHTTTTEKILLHQGRRTLCVDGEDDADIVNKENRKEEEQVQDENGIQNRTVIETVLRERQCEESGMRTLLIRPAVYVKQKS